MAKYIEVERMIKSAQFADSDLKAQTDTWDGNLEQTAKLFDQLMPGADVIPIAWLLDMCEESENEELYATVQEYVEIWRRENGRNVQGRR